MTNKDKQPTVKDSIVETPLFLAEKIYKELARKPFKSILDVGCYRGNLTKPFRRKRNTKIIGLDVYNEFQDNYDVFIHKDFLETTPEDFAGLNIDIVVTNPPFNRHKEYNKLYPDLFLEHIFKLFGDTIPTVMIVGHWYMTGSSERIAKLNKYNLTKTMTLHKRTFEPMSVESSVLYFNIKTKKSFEFVDFKVPEVIQKTKTVAFTKEQVSFVNDNIKNFSGELKEMIKERYPDFPL